jgi:hypothetical protein
MMLTKRAWIILAILLVMCESPCPVLAQATAVEVFCPVCGYRRQFIQGVTPDDNGKIVQHIVVVCERSKQIRNITIPLDPEQPVHDVPLLARQYKTGSSDLLGIRLPRFLVPGNTCPLFPIAAYLERSICPIHGGQGLRYAIVGQY